MRIGVGGVLDDVLALLLIFETIALGQLAIDPFSLYTVGSFAWYQAQIVSRLSPLSPLLVIVLLYAWLAKLILKVARKRSIQVDRFTRALSEIVKGRNKSSQDPEKLILLRHPELLLIVAMTVAGLLAYFPYSPGFNPNGSIVGTDTSSYIAWTQQMLSRPFSQAMAYAFGGADQGFRPLPLILYYSIASLGLSPAQVVEYSPVIFGPLLALSVYIFVRTGSGNNATAAIASLITPFSFQVTVGIWAGYLANWLAMIFAFFFLSALFLFMRSNRKIIIIVPLALLSLALLLTHPWTWGLTIATTIVFAITRPRNYRNLLTMTTIGLAGVGLIVDLARNQLAGGTALATDLTTKGSVFGISQLLMFWSNLYGTLNAFYNGLLGNSVLLGLCGLSFLVISFQHKMEGTLSSWVATSSVPFALFNSFHQTRLIYDLPIPPLAAIGLVLVMSRAGGGSLRASLILMVVVLVSANYALGAVIQA